MDGQLGFLPFLTFVYGLYDTKKKYNDIMREHNWIEASYLIRQAEDAERKAQLALEMTEKEAQVIKSQAEAEKGINELKAWQDKMKKAAETGEIVNKVVIGLGVSAGVLLLWSAVRSKK